MPRRTWGWKMFTDSRTKKGKAMREITYREAVHEAISEEMRRDSRVILMGEDVGPFGGLTGVTIGLIDEFGADRVLETPISECGFVGAAVGAALKGMRPILELGLADVILVAMDQIVNTAAKMNYFYNGRASVPLVCRVWSGFRPSGGPQQSQSNEAMFAHVPGLKVVMPSTPREFKGLLLGAIEDDNPVLMLEHRWLHYITGDVPEGFYSTPLDGPRLAREGQDVTIVASSYMVFEALRAAEALAGAGCTAEVFDLRILRPLALDTILASVQKTGRLITVDTGWRIGGMGAEIVAEITERAFAHLKAPPRRLGLPDHPTPSSRALAAAYYPGSVDIVDAVEQLLELGQGAAETARQACVAARQGVPMDKPDPAFKGPF